MLCTAASAQQTLTVAEGTNEHSWAPFATGSYWSKPGCRTQVIYPAESLTAMVGSDIYSIKFYVKTSGGMWMSGGKSRISMGTTTISSFYNSFVENLTPVAVDVPGPETGMTELEIVFDEPFTYTGGNLVYEWELTEAGDYTTYVTSFVGVRGDKYTMAFLPAGDSMMYLNTEKFTPKTTFTYGHVFVTTKQLDFGELLPNSQRELSVKVKNVESTAVTPVISGLEGPFSSDYTPTTLSPGETLTIPVKFTPTELGEFTGGLTIQCGEYGNYEVALKGNSVRSIDITVCNGKDKTHNLPIHGTYMDEKNTFSQMIYPAEKLTDAVGHKITSIKFYATEGLQWSKPTLELSLGETDQIEFGSIITDLSVCSTTSPSVGDTELVFNFNEPFEYNGGNFAVQLKITKASNFYGAYFYGENQEVNTGYCLYYLNNGQLTDTELVKFLPKMTITFADQALAIPGDLNGDGNVNTGDVSALYKALLAGATDAMYDLNGDGNVNTGDVSALYKIILGN